VKLHWQILIALLAGALVGGLFQSNLHSPPWVGMTFAGSPGAVVVDQLDPSGPGGRAGISPGDEILEVVQHLGDPQSEVRKAVSTVEDIESFIESMGMGEVLWLTMDGTETPLAVPIAMDPESQRARWIAPFAFVADLFLSLLKMLIVPLILSSIITGVAGVGTGRDLSRLGGKTFTYYISTSFLAALLGLGLVNLIRPGEGALLGLSMSDSFEQVTRQSIWDVLGRIVPTNVFSAMSQNGQVLQVIIFALLFGFFITRAPQVHQKRMKAFFDSAFAVMMEMAKFVLNLIPYGVFALLVKILSTTGFGLFKPLGWYMLTVTLALVIHGMVTLPLILRWAGRLSPRRWASAMSPPLLTAFSTSSSSVTLPVTLESVEHRGKVSRRVTSFVLPLGATINMDGTALYECIGVVFLAQYYAGLDPAFALTFGDQCLVVLMALLASIGAAGIPSAGLVMMLTILSALNLPIEGAALLLAVDRPLDMLRTTVNVWSDSCGAAVIARSEGEKPVAAMGGGG